MFFCIAARKIDAAEISKLSLWKQFSFMV